MEEIENAKSNVKEPVLVTLQITLDDYLALKRIRSYFGEHDKTSLEHLAYDVIDRVLKVPL